MSKKVKKKKDQKSEQNERLTGPEAGDRRKALAPEFEGLDDVKDTEALREFIDAVEEAFGALHQASVTLDEEEEIDDKSLGGAWLSDWAQTVEERFNFMGINRRATNMPTNPAPSVPAGVAPGFDSPGLKIWTKSVWARFAALGQVLPVGEE